MSSPNFRGVALGTVYAARDSQTLPLPWHDVRAT